MFLRYEQIGEIFDLLSLGVIVLSPERKIISLNHAAESLTGKKATAVIGHNCYEVFLDYLCSGHCKYLEEPGAEIETVVSEIDLVAPNDKQCSLTKIEFPIFDADHRLKGCIEVFQDHSAFRDLIKRIRFEDLRLKIILDNLDIGVLTVDRGDHISFFNTMAEKITGYSRTELLGKSCDKVFGSRFGKDFKKAPEQLKDGNGHIRVETDLTTREGQRIPVQANYVPLKNEEGSVVGGLTTISDLSLQYHYKSAIRGQYTYFDMVGRHPEMQKIFEIIPVIAASDATVLIEGPTGTGKDLLAKIIHNASDRAGQKLIKVNCASLPDNLLESEMFGYVKGAFTGADRDKPGRFQLADGGTIFLDEIGDLPLALQAKLLRVIEDREFYALGSRQTTRVNVRILSATNQNLKRLAEEKKFREDLFYRLNVMRLELPALKDRKSDLPLLIEHILKRICTTKHASVGRIDEPAMEVLLNYDYPGNVRELENILEHALIICCGDTIEKKHFPLWLLKSVAQDHSDDDISGAARRAWNEKERIIDTLRRYRWNKSHTARALSMDRTTLWRKMKKYQIGEN
ncbi:MAG: sigma 54-interacting transcriptional regulator [Deltaproteobacteria bacterium]|jgi:two-component system response regulator HydG|nr:sigma 54-interacting transcriptional regulator [Deltaproteobacteria bacterium]